MSLEFPTEQVVDHQIAPESNPDQLDERCKHIQFQVEAQVLRQEETIWPFLIKGVVLVKARCAQCGLLFGFPSMPVATNGPNGTTNGTSPDGLTAVLNIMPTKLEQKRTLEV